MVKSQSTSVSGTFRATHIINSDDGVFGKVFLVEVGWSGRVISGGHYDAGEAIIDDGFATLGKGFLHVLSGREVHSAPECHLDAIPRDPHRVVYAIPPPLWITRILRSQGLGHFIGHQVKRVNLGHCK